MHRLVGLVGLVSLVLLVMAVAWGASGIDVRPTRDVGVASPPSLPNATRTKPSPTAEAVVKRMHMFPVPFTVTVPSDPTMKLIHHNGSVVAWATFHAADVVVPSSTVDPYGATQAKPAMGNPGDGTGAGISFATADKSWVHANTPERLLLAGDPASFLQALGDAPGMALGPVNSTAVDGRPALVADVLSRSDAHMHTNGILHGPASAQNMLPMGLPSLFFAFVVGDTTVYIQVWGATDEGLAAFLPEAMALIDSVHFEDPEVLP